VLLTGCGAYDGTDPQEAVLVMLEIQAAGHELVPLAMDVPQFHTVDHTTAQELEGESRRQMQEAARLVRGKLYSLEEISPKLLDALIIPGGQGPVKNLLTGFATLEERSPIESVGRFLGAVHESGGLIGAVSLAEFVVSAVLGPWPEGKGCFDLQQDEVLVDPQRGIYLTPGYTLATSLTHLHAGIHNLCQAMFQDLEKRDKGQ
jgi:enhancing lycopene biosynthesis protein 2